ncbi:myosin-binding protein 1 [Raphanus sativus]|uniref:Myosin-binding protein 1 n=1 Tax=Raphanus sativus TaxID=3726 RepID=A0A6J0KT48_RAPSA|nr:myosin-binding protein 1 [Raphanus sativus]XP_018461720.1 PREDICTED: myosin-binding protein 1-like [Raphanus sativus]
MDTTKMSPAKSQSGSQSLTRALALAFNEWLLMVMLFANSIFTYVITKFADYSQLQSPCLICSRLDHILGRAKHLKESHWDMFCSKHKSEISSLVYCHGKLVDVRGMCETCLSSFGTTNKSSSESYKLLVGKLGEDSNSDQSTSTRNCTCCDQMWIPQVGSAGEVLSKPETLSKIGSVGDVRTGKQTSTPKKSVRFNDLPHVGYTELKIHSDTEPEDEFFEDEGVAVKEDDHRLLQNVDLETPPVITLPYDMATDKLINLDSTLQPLVDLKDQEEIYFPGNDVPVTSEKVLKEEEIISLDNILVTSRAMEHSEDFLKEKEDLIHVQDTSLRPDSKDSPADALVEVSEVSPVNGVSEISEKVLKEEDITSLDHLLLTSRGLEDSAAVMKGEEEDLMVVEEKGLLCLSNVTSTSVAAETPEDLLLMETVIQEKEELVHLQDTSLTPDCKESPADALLEKTEPVCLSDVTSTPSDAAETSEHILQREEKEGFVHLQDTSLGEDSKEISTDALMEKTELTSISDVSISASPDFAETPEDVLKETEMMPLHDTSSDEVPESLTTTNETPAETSKERDTNQTDMTSLESEYVVVSPSKSTHSLPEDPTENCVSENKETKDTFHTVASLSEMASHTEAAPKSESSSFNSMSVAAETNLDSGELLDLADAYNNIIVHNESNKDSIRGAHIEAWMSKDTSRVSQDLKALLTQLSSSRISPRISIDHQETKNLDYDMQLLIQKRMLERNESTLSLEGVSVSEIEGESEIERLKRQVDHDRKFLTGLYKELEEERSASAVATNQAMAMITRLQEEKATFQMEALQNLRMMEEQAEYDMEAIQKLNELLLEREKVIQDLEAEIDCFKNQTPHKKLDENVMSNKVQNCLAGFKEERDYINSCLKNIENMVLTDVNGEVLVDSLETQESVTELRERVEKLKGDLYFLEHVVSSLEHGSEGVQFVKEIASHLQNLSMKRHNHTEI